MAFMTFCTNKGCGENQAPYIDPSNDKVYCSACDGEITNMTYFIKVQLKNLKQFKPKKTSFLVKCSNCGKDDQPKLSTNKKDLLCGVCGKPLNLSEPFKIMMRDKLLNKKDDE